jgi:hypothetical protein
MDVTGPEIVTRVFGRVPNSQSQGTYSASSAPLFSPEKAISSAELIGRYRCSFEY